MRRRIDMSPEDGYLRDVTGKAHLIDCDDDPILALYDDDLWAAYQASIREMDLLAQAVMNRLRQEPYDYGELMAAKQIREPAVFSLENVGGRRDRIHDGLIAYAKTLDGK